MRSRAVEGYRLPKILTFLNLFHLDSSDQRRGERSSLHTHHLNYVALNEKNASERLYYEVLAGHLNSSG